MIASRSTFTPSMLWLPVLAIMVSTLAGFLLATGNFILLGPFIGAIVGGFLLLRPDWMIGIAMLGSLVLIGLLQLFLPGLEKISWAIAAASLMLMAMAWIELMFRPQRLVARSSTMWLALIFMATCLFASVVNLSSAVETAAGFKRLFQLWGLIFAFAAFRFSKQQIDSWLKIGLVVALIQLPFAVYQLLVLVPKRAAIANALNGIVPIDVVAGTFGASLEGGGASGEMAMYLIIVVGFLLSAWREKLMVGKRVALFSVFCLAPLFVGETKVIVIYLPIMFFFVFQSDLLRNPGRFLLLAILFLGLTFVGAYVYFTFFAKQGFDAELESVLNYNFGDAGYGNLKLNRTTVLTFWLEEHGWHNPVQMLFGHGLGSSNLAQGGLFAGSLAQKYASWGIGLTTISSLLWEVGLFGVFIFFALLRGAWRTASALLASSSAWVRSQAVAVRAALALFAFSLFYRSTLMDLMSFQVVFTALLGYLVWLEANHSRLLETAIESSDKAQGRT